MWEKLQQQLSLRDQAMLALLAAALVLYVLYQALWRPLATANQHLAEQNVAATNSLGAINQLASEYRQLLQANAQNGAASGEGLPQLVDRTIAANNLHMSRFQPGSGGDAQVRLDNAVFDDVLRWLNEMESTHAATIKELAISPGSGAGLVNVSVRLFRP